MVFKEAEKRHHNPGCTISALASIGLHQHLLNRMQNFVIILRNSQVLHGDELFAMDHRKKEQTGIDGTVRKAAIRVNFGKYHGTGAAVSLGTTLFDSLMSMKGAEIG